MSALARSRIERPRNSAIPHSMATLSTVFFNVVTTSPAASWPTIFDVPILVVECRTRKSGPRGEYSAPRAKSQWAPLRYAQRDDAERADARPLAGHRWLGEDGSAG